MASAWKWCQGRPNKDEEMMLSIACTAMHDRTIVMLRWGAIQFCRIYIPEDGAHTRCYFSLITFQNSSIPRAFTRRGLFSNRWHITMAWLTVLWQSLFSSPYTRKKEICCLFTLWCNYHDLNSYVDFDNLIIFPKKCYDKAHKYGQLISDDAVPRKIYPSILQIFEGYW